MTRRSRPRMILFVCALMFALGGGLWSMTGLINIPSGEEAPGGSSMPITPSPSRRASNPTVLSVALTTRAPVVVEATSSSLAPTSNGGVILPRFHNHSWLKQHALTPTDAERGHVLQLTPAALRAVREGVKRPEPCPTRYLFVNTHTYGRHHNQLQEMLNLAVWARTLNRTAVMGWFRFNHRWTEADELYDFSAIYRDYCAVSAETFVKQWKRLPAEERTAGCIGQGVNDTPLKGIVRRCRQQPGVGPYYNSRQGVDATVALLAMMMNVDQLRDARFLGVSGQIAFFLRPGLLEQAAVTTRLGLHANVRREAEQFASANTLRLEGGSESVKGGRPFFGLHLRQREKECAKEMSFTFEDGGDMVKDILNPTTRRAIESQCALTVAVFDDLHKRVVPSEAATTTALFLASDHQNVALEAALQKRGAVMVVEGGSRTGLTALGMDFYLLQRGAYFAGNQLSSISQNCCFARLGAGLACHGFVTDFTLFHSRATDPHVLVHNVVWPSGQ